MLRLFFPDIYGEEPRDALFEDAVFAGHVRKGQELDIGTFSLFVYKPDSMHPRAELTVRCNGAVSTSQDKLKKIGEKFIEWSKSAEIADALEGAIELEDDAAQGAALEQVARRGLNNGRL